MHKQKSKLRERTQLVFIYSLMIAAIVSMLAILVLVIQGYRYNRFDGRIEQGGLVQFNSRPSGATVSVDDIELANKTASKITLTAGEHTVKMWRSGYNEWKKAVDVRPGTVLWLNYTLLFPTKPVVSTGATFDQVTSVIVAPNNEWLAAVSNPKSANIHLVRLGTDTPTSTSIALPVGSYTAAADETTHSFKVMSWDKDSESVLVQHDYDGKREYLVATLRGGEGVYNLTTQLGVDASQVSFSQGDSNVLYLLTTANELRRATISSSTLSGPLATNVSGFSATDDRIITYETFADSLGKRGVGYVSGGSNKSKQIASYELANEVSLHARVGMYYGDRFLTVAHGGSIDIMSGSLPQSDSNDTLDLDTVSRIDAASNLTWVGFSPGDNRMVYAQSGDKLITYDLELNLQSAITLPASAARVVDWIDGFHVATTAGGTATYYDYDGTNVQQIADVALDLPIALSSNDKYLYYFAPSEHGVSLYRVRLAE
ncbi:MAG: PEGA domain-containing protein [Candidatus Saccharimonas sp.]